MAVTDACASLYLSLLVILLAGSRIVHSEDYVSTSIAEECYQKAAKCCYYDIGSLEFYKCCGVFGCCPTVSQCLNQVDFGSSVDPASTTSNPYSTAAVDSQYVANYYEPPPEPEEGCEYGRVCCRFPPHSAEFAQCSEDHQCRPSCYDVPKGCCYNGREWLWGSVVERLEEVCLNLKCAAKKLYYPPYLAAELVLVPDENSDCSDPLSEHGCGDCVKRRCVDKTGLVRDVGETFYLGKCLKCKCLPGGSVECEEVIPICPPVPTYIPSYCQLVTGMCCPTLKCSVERTCRDNYQKLRALYSTWRSDPCTTHKCTLAGILTQREHCPPMPHPNCMREGELEEAGPSVDYEESSEEVSKLYYSEGSQAEVSEEEDIKCCHDWICGLDCRTVHCSFKPPEEDCTEVYEPLDCCPKWNCSGCLDAEYQYHPVGSVWHPTLCTSLACTPLGVINTTVPCKPKPHEGCIEESTYDSCCPVYNCGGCVDSYRIVRPLYSTWEEKPCKTFTCTPNGIVPVQIDKYCPPKPHENCYEGPIGEDCCPVWKCGIDCSLVRCEGPPHFSCIPYMPPLSCCPKWNCSTTVCMDNGVQRPAGSMWRTSDPCTNQTCTDTGHIVTVSASCASSSAPHEGCFQYRPEGECCPRWNCSGCLDENGVYHKLYEAWTTDSCSRHYCNYGGIYTQKLECSTLGLKPHDNCIQKIEPGECCPSWKCGPDCRLVFCPLPPEGNCVKYRPPLACCDQYECSGCITNTGKQLKIEETWFEAPCFMHFCRQEGLSTYNMCDGQYPSYQTKRRRSTKLGSKYGFNANRNEASVTSPESDQEPEPASNDTLATSSESQSVPEPLTIVDAL